MVSAAVASSYASCACNVRTAGLSLHSQVSTSASPTVSHTFASSRQSSARHGRYLPIPTGLSPLLRDDFVLDELRDHIGLIEAPWRSLDHCK